MGPSQIVTYAVDNEMAVQFEIVPVEGFALAGVGELAGRVRNAVGPAIAAAQVVLEPVRELRGLFSRS